MAARRKRTRSEADIYHVYSRGSGRQLIYEDDDDRFVFLKYLCDALDSADAELFAYCLMGNHYHMVIRSDYDRLPQFAHALNCRYARYFNKHHGRSGHLFQGRFNSEPIEDDYYFLTAIRYVHRNPVEAHIVPSCVYEWSSYLAYVPSETLHQVKCFRTYPKVSTEMALDMLGGTEAFAEFHAHSGNQSFIDDLPVRTRIPESELVAIARSTLSGFEPADIKSLPKSDRDAALRVLRHNALSISQIAMLTGISRSTVQRATCNSL